MKESSLQSHHRFVMTIADSLQISDKMLSNANFFVTGRILLVVSIARRIIFTYVLEPRSQNIEPNIRARKAV